MPRAQSDEQLVLAGLRKAVREGKPGAANDLSRHLHRTERDTTITKRRQAALDKKALASVSRARHVLVDPNSPPERLTDHEIMAEMSATNHACDIEDATPGAREAANAEAVKILRSLGGAATAAELCAAGWVSEDSAIVRCNRLIEDGLATARFLNFPASSRRRFTLTHQEAHHAS